MAKLRAGILGQVSGKVSGVVGGTWKDKNYVREYVIPANPNTAGQQLQRGKFGRAVDFCKPLVGPVFNVYTDKFQAKMSGFNFFIKSNIAEFTDPPVYANVKVTEGKLFYARITSVSGDVALNKVQFQTSVSLGSNGAADDGVYAVALNVDTGRWGFIGAEYDRSGGDVTKEIDLNLGAGAVIQLWTFAIQRVDGIINIISDSDNDTAIAV